MKHHHRRLLQLSNNGWLLQLQLSEWLQLWLSGLLWLWLRGSLYIDILAGPPIGNQELGSSEDKELGSSEDEELGTNEDEELGAESLDIGGSHSPFWRTSVWTLSGSKTRPRRKEPTELDNLERPLGPSFLVGAILKASQEKGDSWESSEVDSNNGTLLEARRLMAS